MPTIATILATFLAVSGIALGLESSDGKKHGSIPHVVKPPIVKSPCDRKEVLETHHCRGSKTCLYPYHGACSKFVQCVPTNKEGDSFGQVLDCPEGLHWNNDKHKKHCDWPHNVTCHKKKKSKSKNKKKTKPHPHS